MVNSKICISLDVLCCLCCHLCGAAVVCVFVNMCSLFSMIVFYFFLCVCVCEVSRQSICVSSLVHYSLCKYLCAYIYGSYVAMSLCTISYEARFPASLYLPYTTISFSLYRHPFITLVSPFTPIYVTLIYITARACL